MIIVNYPGLNGVTWTSPKHDGFTVLKPSSLDRINYKTDIVINTDPNDPTHIVSAGYRSTITYKLLDQFSQPLANTGVNESFGTFASDYTGENWGVPNATGENTDGDGIFVDRLWKYDDGTANPHPDVPSDPPGTIKVQHASQSYYGGSTAPGQGCELSTGVAEYYIEHADHEG